MLTFWLKMIFLDVPENEIVYFSNIFSYKKVTQNRPELRQTRHRY